MGVPCSGSRAGQGRQPGICLLTVGSCRRPEGLARGPSVCSRRKRLTCWLMRRMAISFRSVNSWKADSMTLVCVSVGLSARRSSCWSCPACTDDMFPLSASEDAASQIVWSFPIPSVYFPHVLRREHASCLPSLGPFVSKKDLLESTIKKFFFWCWSTCPIPARSRPVMESYRVSTHSQQHLMLLRCRRPWAKPEPARVEEELTSSPITANRLRSFRLTWLDISRGLD